VIINDTKTRGKRGEGGFESKQQGKGCAKITSGGEPNDRCIFKWGYDSGCSAGVKQKKLP